METITFYSYKGGVGRSLAISHIAERFSELSQNVFLIDFDLEAPGLHYKFKNEIKKSIEKFGKKKGLVDYLYDFFVLNAKKSLPEVLSDYFYELHFEQKNKQGSVFLMTAGNINKDDYWERLSAIDWKLDFLSNEKTGISLLIDLKARIFSEINPNYLLIDSRTGITDVTTLTLKVLADKVVVMAANNEENLDGAYTVLQTLNSEENVWNGKKKELFLSLTRLPRPSKKTLFERENEIVKKIKERFRSQFIDETNFVVLHEDTELLWEEKKIIDIRGKQHYELKEDYFKLLYALTKNLPHTSLLQKVRDKEAAELNFIHAVERKEKNKYKEALSFINQAIRLNPSEAEYYSLKSEILFIDEGNYKDAVLCLDKSIEIDPEEVKYYVYRAMTNQFAGSKEEALLDIDEAMKLDVDTEFLYTQKGKIYLWFEEYDAALENLNKAIELNANYYPAFEYRGMVYSQTKEYEKALVDFSLSIDADSNYADNFFNRANVYYEINEFDKAIEDYTSAIKIDPSNDNFYLQRANAFDGNEDYTSALRDISIAIGLDSSNILYFIRRMKYNLNLKNFNDALSDSLKILEKEPDKTEVLISHSFLLGKLGKYADAIDYCKKAISINPQADYYNTLADLYLLAENPQAALEEINKATLLEENGLYYGTLAEVYSQLNNHDLVYENLKKALELGCSISNIIETKYFDKYKDDRKFQNLIEKYKNNN